MGAPPLLGSTAGVSCRGALGAKLARGGALALLLSTTTCTRAENPSYPETVRADGPSSYWRFGEGEASMGARDELGVADAKIADGVTTNAEPAIGADPNRAFAFDGLHGAVVAPDRYTFEGRHAFTIELWIAPAAGGAPLQRICNHRIGPKHTGWRLVRDQPGRVTFERWSGDALLGSVSAEVTIGVYSHLVARYDGASIELYVDGVLRQAAPDAHDLARFAQALVWGAGNVGDIDFFAGRLDEAAIYDFALAPERIAAHHAAAGRR